MTRWLRFTLLSAYMTLGPVACTSDDDDATVGAATGGAYSHALIEEGVTQIC